MKKNLIDKFDWKTGALSAVLICLLVIVPAVASAQDLGLIVCDPASDVESERCNFGHLMLLVRNLINALIIFSTFFATAAFAWAGIVLLSSGGDVGKKNKAKEIFFKVLMGYLWILGAWVLVYTITSVLLKDPFNLLRDVQ